MTDPKVEKRASDPIDLTRSIKSLSLPSGGVADTFDDEEGTALLLCRDSAAKKWGPRWFEQAGLQASVPAELADGLAIARDLKPDVVVVDAGQRGRSGSPLFQDLADAVDMVAPIIVLCANSKELEAAMDADVFDVVRKPHEWQVVSRRAKYGARLSQAQSRLAASEDSLAKALALADDARERLRSRESFEPVTGLPNQTKFMDLLRRAMAATDRDAGQLAVFVIGFTRFRLVVEAMGQEQADLVLTEIGHNLADCLRGSANPQTLSQGLRTAAAASLDQFRFGLMLTSAVDDDGLAEFQQRLLDTLSRPVQVSGQTVYLSGCIGVTLYPQDATDADSLLQRADNAMRDAQSRGGGFKYYCNETDAAAARKLKIEHLLHEALDRGELSLAYQPINNVADNRVVAAEALLRWRQADGSYVSPAEFIPVAEESGLIIRAGEFVLDEACGQLQSWRAEGITVPLICVNVAKAQLVSPGFVQSVKRILDKHELDPSGLELEISERGVLSGDYDVINQLHELKQLGVRLSIDDFGTGDSAIAYLKELPIDVLKIDRSYIAGLTINRKDAAIASAMVALGQRLDLLVIAEGVETTEQLATLRDLGCDAYQGFLVSEAVSGNAFKLLTKSSGSTE